MSQTSNSILMYGGGLIGGAAAAALSRDGQSVTVVTRAPEPQYLAGVDWRFGDIQGERSAELLRQRKAVIFAAGSMSPASQVQSVALTLSEQVVPVVSLAEQAAAQAVPTFVFISSGGTVYGQTRLIPTPEDSGIAPINAYGMVKAQTEQALLEVGRRTGMTIVVLRVANPYGLGQQGTRRLGFVAAAVEAARRGDPVNIWGDGTVTRDFVHIDDVADAIARAADYRSESAIFNVGTGRETSLLKVCDLVGKISGHPLEIIFHEARSVDVQRNCLNVRKAREVLGWSPSVELESGLANLLG